MRLTTKQYAIALYQELASSKPSEHDEILAQFIRLLAAKNRLSLLPQIAEQLKRYLRAEQGIALVRLTTAQSLPESTLKKMKKTLQNQLGTVVELGTILDKTIIGGAIIQLNDTVINGSVAQALTQLRNTLAESRLTA